MTPERWKQVEEVFQDALDLAPGERGRFIAEACAQDAELRAEVEALVGQYESAGEFIESPAMAGGISPASAAFATAPTVLADDALMAGRRIGAYRVVREIGRGGMGAVYLAVRADSEFQKRVAIKLVKRGMDTDFILRRFRNERQILASLDHPHIARLLDGGTTEDGLPYFVMDYIEGQPLYRYCDGQKLTVAERVKLFCQICSAVQYAHQNLVVHRDIKPNNILVTADGTPKLLDFGIAKLLNPELTPDTITPTATAMRLMTPEYASPEQARGEAATPASDIYSLGVLLYEILTGHRPYHFSNRAQHEIARFICEDEPPHPSHVVARDEDILPPDLARSEPTTLEFLCKNRGTTLEELRRELVGDLDNITLKALRKEPGRRYASVDQLREDITRHLEGRPVSAPFFFPATTKTARLLAGEPLTGEKSIAVLPFKFLVTRPAGETGDGYLGIGLTDALITRLSNLRRCLVRPTSSVLRYGSDDADPFVAGYELGVDFVADGRIQRTGERTRVTVQLLSVRDGATVWAAQFDAQYTDVLSLEDAISAQVAEALVPQLTGDERLQLAKRGTDDPEAYEAYLRGRYHWSSFTEEGFAKALTCYYRAISLDPTYAAPYTGIADYHNWLGVYGVLPFVECSAAAKEAARKAVELDATSAEAYSALGFAIGSHDFDWATAEQQHHRALELNPNYATAHQWHGFHLLVAGRFDEAIAEMQRAVDLDPFSPSIQQSLGWAYYQARRFDESIAAFRKMLEAEPRFAYGRLTFAWVLRHVGLHEEAIAEAQQALELAGESQFYMVGLGGAYAAAGRREEAHEVLRRLHEMSAKRYVSPYHLALIHCHLGDREGALAALEQAFAVRDGWLIWLGVEPQIDPLRDNPRLIDLLRRTNNPTIMRPEDQLGGTIEKEFAEQPTVKVAASEQLMPAAGNGDGAIAAARPSAQTRSSLRLAVIPLIVIIAASIAAFAYWNSSRQPSPVVAQTNPLSLTNNLATDWHPKYSPDGTRIVFASDRDGNFEIYVMNADGSAPRRLTHNSAEDLTPVWSPDSTKIAFTSKRDGNDEIYVMNADGSDQTNISRHPAADSRPAWSPDGTRLAFVSNREADGSYDIYVTAANGGEPTRLTDDPHFDGDPAWSPDGSEIAFTTDRDGNFEIYTMAANGTRQTNVSNNPAFDGKPAWSPDGASIAFTSNRDVNPSDFDIYVMDADGRDPRKLTDNNVTDDEPHWSPDGNYLVYQSERGGDFEIDALNVLASLRSVNGRDRGVRSLAVLPFATTGAAGDGQYLGVGIADALTNKLGQLDDMTLRTSGTVRRYLGSPKSALEAGREMGVDNVLSGTVERVGDRVQLSLELTDVAQGRVLWAEKFNDRFTDLSALQSSISERVARALSLELTGDELRRLNERPTADSEAYQLYMAGRYHWGKRTAEGLRQAIDNFERAIEKDGKFALAYTGLADCYALLNWYVEPPPADAFAHAKQAALKAVELDEALAEAHVSLAFIKFHYDRDWPGAEQQFRRAINLNPNYPTAHHWYAFNLSAAGRHEEAVTEIKHAQELDPRSPVIAAAVANILYLARRYDEAIEQSRQALDLDPGSVAAHVVMRWASEKKGAHDAAFAIYEKERAFAGDTPTTKAKHAHVLASTGRAAAAQKILQELLAQRQRQAVTPYEIAVIYALLGDKDSAFKWLAQASKDHAVGFTFVRVDPLLDNLRDDPRYAALLRSAGMPN
ncbi:hypothetical protein BH18ACI2_BH18ACI2_07710 [soil metagenome]